MADFGINATQLTEAQGRGANPLAPVEQSVVSETSQSLFQVIGGVVEEGAKWLKADAKAQAEARKLAVINEYTRNQTVYNDALTSGQWNAAQVATASRANYQKLLNAYPEYMQELASARQAVFTGTETGEAQRKVDAENKQFEQDISDASKLGYQFYAGQSEASKMANVDAWKAARREEAEYEKARKRVTDGYADNAEARAAGTYNIQLQDRLAKEQAFDGTRTVAAKNFDAVQATATDLMDKVSSGQMSYEVAMQTHSMGIQRVRAGIKAIAGQFPEAASMWDGLFTEMDSTVQKLLDPNKKSENEVKLLKDRFEKLKLTAQIAAVERDPQLMRAVAASDLFRNEPILQLVQQAPVKRWLLSATGVDPALQTLPVVGTTNDKQVFGSVTQLLQSVEKGTFTPEAKVNAQKEAMNMVNTLLNETAGVSGELPASSLKEASKFFASPEFGRMAVEGKLDKQTAANAQHVFQTMYEPAVRTAVISTLQKEVSNSGEALLRSVEIGVVGGKVVFNSRDLGAKENGSLVNGWIDRGMRGHDIKAGRKDLKAAEDGLNQLIRLHAHLEGTTDYANYWEKNKHLIMPDIYPDPRKLKPGTVTDDGYEYLGGNVNDKRNWIAKPKPAAK